ncbi:MAG: DUF308 domain-containing protein [Bacillota bacterium]|nr:DUF308 domain-containing protein [Bacillota bacterium]
MRVLTIIGGILMIAGGAFCFINSGQTFLNIAFVVGAIMVINGVIHSLAYFVGRGLHNKGDNNGWILIDGLLTLLLGVLILCNQLVVDIAIPMIFGMWVLVSGLLRIEAASRINRERKSTNFKATLITGIATTCIGIFGFVDPLFTWVTVVSLLGIFLILQGINAIELGIDMPHEKKSYIRVYRRPKEAVIINDEVDEKPDAVASRFETQKEKEQQAEQIEMIENIATRQQK